MPAKIQEAKIHECREVVLFWILLKSGACWDWFFLLENNRRAGVRMILSSGDCGSECSLASLEVWASLNRGEETNGWLIPMTWIHVFSTHHCIHPFRRRIVAVSIHPLAPHSLLGSVPLLCHLYLLPVMEHLAEQLQGKRMHAACSLRLESGGEGTVEFTVAGEGDGHRSASRQEKARTRAGWSIPSRPVPQP